MTGPVCGLGCAVLLVTPVNENQRYAESASSSPNKVLLGKQSTVGNYFTISTFSSF